MIERIKENWPSVVIVGFVLALGLGLFATDNYEKRTAQRQAEKAAADWRSNNLPAIPEWVKTFDPVTGRPLESEGAKMTSGTWVNGQLVVAKFETNKASAEDCLIVLKLERVDAGHWMQESLNQCSSEIPTAIVHVKFLDKDCTRIGASSFRADFVAPFEHLRTVFALPENVRGRGFKHVRLRKITASEQWDSSQFDPTLPFHLPSLTR